MRRTALFAALVVAPLLGLPAVAEGQQVADWDPPTPQGFTLVPRSGGSLELGFSLDGTRTLSISGLLRLGIVLEETVDIRLSGGFAYGSLDTDTLGVGGDAGAFANPTLTVGGIVGEERWRLRFGGGLTIPGVPSSRSAAMTAFYAAATQGLGDLWLWIPQGFTPVLGLSLEAMPVDHLYLEIGAVAGGVFTLGNQPIIPQQEDNVFDLTVDASAAVGVRLDGFFGGVRGRGVILPTLETIEYQTSLELFLRGRGMLGETSLEIFGEVRGFANLDPLPAPFDDQFVWGAFVSVGVGSTPAEITEGRFGVSAVTVRGMDALDDQALLNCLGTRARSTFNIDLPGGPPECGQPPFDQGRLRIGGWSWPWSEWPLFDESVFERDLERIERWFRARGYYDARVVASEVEPPEATAVDGASEQCTQGGDEECTAQVTFHVEEGEPVRIARMSLRGIDTLPEGMRQQLRAVLQLSRGQPFDEARFEDTKRRMLRVLADAGYAHARVDGEVKINRRRHEAFVIFVIRPSLPNVIGRVCVEGYGDELPPDVMLAVAGLDPGEGFSLELIEEAQRALYALGVFSGVQVSPVELEQEEAEGAEEEEPLEEHTARPVISSEDVDVDVEAEDVHCQAGPTEVRAGTEPVDIRIEVTPGRLERWGFGAGTQIGQAVTFGTVAAYADQQDAAQWDLHASFLYEHRNVAERLIRARFEVRLRPLIFQMPFFNFTLAEPLFFGAQVSGSLRIPSCLEPRTNCIVQVRYDLGPEPFTGFYRSELDGQLGPERSWFDGRLYLGAFVHGNWFLPTDRQPIEPTDQLPQTFAVWLEEAIRLDLRDDPRNPTAGAYFSVGSQQSVQPLSAWDLVRVTAEARGYLPLPLGIVLAGRFEIGVTQVFGYNQDLLTAGNVYQLAELGPPALHLRGGGASSNRGYLPGLLGDSRQVYVSRPRSTTDIAAGAPITERPVRITGGTSLWEASVELRVPVTESFGIVAFADAGDVVRPDVGSSQGPIFYFGGDDNGTFRPHLSFGLGIRYRTIVGPIRLDFAVAPDELREFGDVATLPPTCAADDASSCNPRNYMDFGLFQVPGAFHLTIGESF